MKEGDLFNAGKLEKEFIDIPVPSNSNVFMRESYKKLEEARKKNKTVVGSFRKSNTYNGILFTEGDFVETYFYPYEGKISSLSDKVIKVDHDRGWQLVPYDEVAKLNGVVIVKMESQDTFIVGDLVQVKGTGEIGVIEKIKGSFIDIKNPSGVTLRKEKKDVLHHLGNTYAEAVTKKEDEPINKDYDYINPSHYQKGGKEVIEMMEDVWGTEKLIAHCEMCAFKYRMRLGEKPDQPIERDLEKANWYENKARELKHKIGNNT